MEPYAFWYFRPCKTYTASIKINNRINTQKMNRLFLILCLTLFSCKSTQAQIPPKKDILKSMQLANDYFMNKWQDVGKTIITNKERPSNIWTRGVYYEGLMALYEIYPKEAYYDYAYDWAEFHNWGF